MERDSKAALTAVGVWVLASGSLMVNWSRNGGQCPWPAFLF
jgi:hypothetical protein